MRREVRTERDRRVGMKAAASEAAEKSEVGRHVILPLPCQMGYTGGVG